MATATAPIDYKSPLDTILNLLTNRATDTEGQQNTSQQLAQILQNLTQGSTSGTSTTSNTAQLGQLQQVFDQNIGGMSADNLKNLITSIFTEGSAQIPALTQAYANATGSRSSGNSGLQLALGDLNRQLSTQAVQALLQQNQASQQTAANAASNIAANTRETTQQQQQQTQQQQNQNTNQTTTGTQQTNQQQTQGIKPNTGNLGIAAGGALLQQLLKGGKGLGGLFSGSSGVGDSGLSGVGGAGQGALSFSSGPTPGGITSFSGGSGGGGLLTSSKPSFSGTAPTGTSQFLGQTGLASASSPVNAPTTNFAAPAAATPNFVPTSSGIGFAQPGAASAIGQFAGDGLMAAGSNINFGGLAPTSLDFFGGTGGLGMSLGAGEASTLGGAMGPWGNVTSGSGGITDFMSSGGSGFSDFLGGTGSFLGNAASGIGDALSGAADWLGSFFADGGQVGQRRGQPGYANGGQVMGARPYSPFWETSPHGNAMLDALWHQQQPQMHGQRGYADGGGIGAPGDTRYRGTSAGGPAPIYGANLFDTIRQQQALQAGLTAPPVQMQQGNIPRVSGPLPAPTMNATAALIPFLLQQMFSPGSMSQPPGGGFADGGMPGIFGLADGGRNTSSTGRVFGMAGGPVRNQNYLGVADPRQSSSAVNYLGYDNPELAQYVNQGGTATEYIDPAARAAELAARALAEQQFQQQNQGSGVQIGGGAQTGVGTAAQTDLRQQGINQNLAMISQQYADNPQLQATALQNLATQTETQDPEVANYYRALSMQIASRQADISRAGMESSVGSSTEGSGVATGATSVSQGEAGLSGGITAPGISQGMSAASSAVGVPGIVGSLAAAAINAIGNTVSDAVADAAAPGGQGNAGDAASASSSTGSAADAPGGASGIGGMGSGNSGGDEGAATDASAAPGSASTDADGGGGGGGGSKIICTAMNDMYGLPYRENLVWLGYSRKHLTPAHQVGYHKVFLPLVDYGFKRGDGWKQLLLRSALIWIGKNRTSDIQNELAGRKRNLLHRTLRAIAEPTLAAIGRWSK